MEDYCLLVSVSVERGLGSWSRQIGFNVCVRLSDCCTTKPVCSGWSPLPSCDTPTSRLCLRIGFARVPFECTPYLQWVMCDSRVHMYRAFVRLTERKDFPAAHFIKWWLNMIYNGPKCISQYNITRLPWKSPFDRLFVITDGMKMNICHT